MINLDIAAFRAAFHAFADETKYPDALLNALWEQSKCYLSPCDSECVIYKQWLMLAHLLYMQDQAASGAAPRQITSAHEGDVSTGFAAPSSSSGSDWGYWLTLSPYGLQLAALLKRDASIGIFVGGAGERSAFRGIGGAFSGGRF